MNRIMNSMMVKRFLLSVLVAGAVVCAGESSVFAQNGNAYKVEIQNVTTVSDGIAEYITGVAVNRSSRTYSAFMITYDLFDAEGALVGNTNDVVQNFQPGQKWKFKMMITEESAKKFRFSGMDAE